MTEMGLRYMSNVEEARHNRATEAENARSNLANEAIGQQNAASNAMNASTNQKQLAINRKNAKSQRMQAKASTKQAKAASKTAKAAWKNAKTQSKAQKEQKRTNKANEALRGREVNVKFSLGSGANQIAREKNAITRELGKKSNLLKAKQIKQDYKLGVKSIAQKEKQRKTSYKTEVMKQNKQSERNYANINANRALNREKIKGAKDVAKYKGKVDKYIAAQKNVTTLGSTLIKGGADITSAKTKALGNVAGALTKIAK